MAWVPGVALLLGTVAFIYIVATVAAIAVYRRSHDRRGPR